MYVYMYINPLFRFKDLAKIRKRGGDKYFNCIKALAQVF